MASHGATTSEGVVPHGSAPFQAASEGEAPHGSAPSQTTGEEQSNKLGDCSVGIFLKQECHKASHKVQPALLFEEDVMEDEWKLILARVDKNVTSICAHHAKVFIEYYSVYYGKRCCDPLNLHQKRKSLKKSKTLRSITYDLYTDCVNNGINVTPGKVMCITCFLEVNGLLNAQEAEPEDIVVQEEHEDTQDEAQEEESYEPLPSIHLEDMEEICRFLELTPIKHTLRLSKPRRVAKAKRKLSQIEDAAKKKLHAALELEDEKSVPEEESNMQKAMRLASDYEHLIDDIKSKMSLMESRAEQVQLLTFAPIGWSGNKIATEFKVSRYLAYKSVHLRKEKGIMPEIGAKQGVKLPQATLEAVDIIYHDDEFTRSFPGMKDSLSVKIGDNRVRKQKRLVLCDLKDLHTAYLDRVKENPQLKIGFSTFAKLRPKWCVLAGSPGTHSVCVCTYHQNVKQ